jgi:hypothetical protein
MSTARPKAVNGFRICDETVSSWTVVKKKASPSEKEGLAERVDLGSVRVALEQVDEDRPDRVDDHGPGEDQ